LHSILCPRCGETVESPDHALVTCPEVKELWKLVGKWWKKNLDVGTIHELLQENNSGVNSREISSIWPNVKWAIMYLLWAHRNILVFKGKEKRNLRELFLEWQRVIFDWLTKRSRRNAISWKD